MSNKQEFIESIIKGEQGHGYLADCMLEGSAHGEAPGSWVIESEDAFVAIAALLSQHNGQKDLLPEEARAIEGFTEDLRLHLDKVVV